MTVTSTADGETITADAGVVSTVAGAPVVEVANNDVVVDNSGTLATNGVTQTIQVNQGTTGANITNQASGTLLGDSRVVNIDGTDVTLVNDGTILGTGSQRNGAVYGNRTSNNISVTNSVTGSIDAGVEGAGIAIEVGGGGAPRTGSITNAGTIQGRGQAAPTGGTAGDGIRFFGPGLAPEYIYAGDITNSGTINSESLVGTTAGIRFANRIGFQGTLTNEAGGTISGANNGLYFGNDADHTGGVVNNAGTISSDSRALNIDGTGLVVNNTGSIIGTGNQRNGTVYADSTAQDFTLNNDSTIDAGAGNQGAGFAVELSETGNDFDINNAGTIQGRGTAGAGLATAGDGVRFERTRVAGMLDGTTSGLFTGDITNSGTIASEGDSGTTAGIRFVNGVSFSGTIDNSGTISGVQNGLYFGNATPAGGGDFTGAVVNNTGIISSGSRALNIDGSGLTINNLAGGSIIGTGNQRNGTVYADATAQDFTLNNDGTIDAGMGNDGAGFAAQLSTAGNSFDINNTGTIQGRGTAAAGLTTAGDGIRFERTRNAGVLDGTTSGLFTGNITNSGTIASEGDSGTTAGIRFVNGVSFAGTIDNSGTISGVQNGLYFGNPTPAGGGDFSQAIVNNSGTISSGSRALNIDGTGLTVNNSGMIVSTGAQRNGTVYADGTANNFTLNNTGTIDAGVAGSGVSFQLGVNDGDTRSFTLLNDGTIAGRGDAQASGASAGLRLFNGAGAGTTVTVADDIVNNGTISSETGAALLIENIDYTGTFTNNGTLSGASSVDASTALSALNFVQNGGGLNGTFIGSTFADTLNFASGNTNLASDILGNVDVTIAEPSTVTVAGMRTINGSLTANGTLNFDLREDSLNVEGNTVLGANSVVNITTDLIGQADIGSTINVITETGTFIDNGVQVNVADNDFLIDYNVNLGSVTVDVVAQDLTAVSGDANVSSFGAALNGALAANSLQAETFTALNALTDAAGFEAASLALLPSINEGITREIYETQNETDGFIADRLEGEGTNLWTRIIGRTSDNDAQRLSVTGYDADAYGFAVGVDTNFGENLVVGVAFSAAEIDVDEIGGAQQATEINSVQVQGYFGYSQDTVYVNGQLGYSFNSVDTTRTGLTDTILGDYDINGVRARIEAGYDLGSETFAITPFVGLQYANLSSDQYTETGGLDLTVNAGDVDFFEGRVGAAFATKGDNFSVKGRAAYVYDFSADARTFDLSFAGAPGTFRVQTGDLAQSRIEYGASVEYGGETGFGIGLGYQGESASGYQSHAGVVTLRHRF